MILEKIADLLDSCSPVSLPWFKTQDDGTPANHLHQMVFSLQWKHQQRIKVIIKIFLWPIKFFILASGNVKKYGLSVKKEWGINRWTQWCQMLYLANFYNISPNAYYKFRIFEKSNIKKAGQYFSNDEKLILFEALYKNVDTEMVDNKARFFKQCVSSGLPVPPAFAVFGDDGKEEWFERPAHDLPPVDVFLKFTNFQGSIGVKGWTYDSAAQVWRRNEQALDKSQLVDYCRARALQNKRPVMIQPRLANHPEIAQFTGGALCTFRVVTYVMPGGKAGLLLAVLRMPVGSMEIDSLEKGGIAAGIDAATGMLGPASSNRMGEKPINSHPDTRAQIAGYRLACWQDIINLSIKAQECFGGVWSIGWDIAMTAQGPVIIEGNTRYCFDLPQICFNKPLGETDFPSLFLEAWQNRKGAI